MKIISIFCCLFSLVMASPNFDSFPMVAIHSAGEAAVLWEGGKSQIQAASYQTGVWSSSTSISDPNSFYADIALNDSQHILAVWQTYQGSSFQIEAIATTLGNGWATPILLPDQAGSNIYPKIAIDQNGDGVAVWQSLASGKTSVFASSFTGGNWSSPQQVSPSSNLLVGPRVAVNKATGEAIAIWKQLNNLTTQIQTAFLPLGESWSSPEALSVETTNASNAQVVFSSSGEAISAWHQDSSDKQTIEIQARVRSSEGVWGDPWVRSDTEKQFLLPRLDMNDSGDAVMVWLVKEAEGQSIETASYHPSNKQWGEVTSLTTAQVELGAPQVSINTSGEAIAVWTTKNEQGKSTVQAAFLSAEGSWSEVQSISSGLQDSVRPSAGIDATGDAIVAWQEVTDIKATIFSGSWSSPVVIGKVD